MSHRIHTPRPFSAATALLALIVGFALTLVASPAFAHDELIGSSPAAGSEVDALPAEITLTFSGVLIDGAGTTQIVVTDASGADITGGDPVLDGTKVTKTSDTSAKVTASGHTFALYYQPLSQTVIYKLPAGSYYGTDYTGWTATDGSYTTGTFTYLTDTTITLPAPATDTTGNPAGAYRLGYSLAGWSTSASANPS